MAETTRERLLQLLENNRGIYLSGEMVAEEIGISRTAVWKAVTGLKNDGYEIDAVRNRGYRLKEDTDVLSAAGICRYLGELTEQVDIEVFSEIGSTNTYLTQKAIEGAPEGSVAVAGSQSAGKGRRGKSFSSPAGSGVYMSILLRPGDMPPEKAVHITTMAAVSVCEAIEDISDHKAEIKWVNDVFMNGRKVCGILTEASFGPETGELEYIIVGIGINVYAPENGFDESIRDIAGAVLTGRYNDARNRIAAGVIRHFMSYYHDSGRSYVDEYKRRSMVIGRDINVLKADGPRPAVAIEIDDECHLIVRYPDGSSECLSSGEISIRMK